MASLGWIASTCLVLALGSRAAAQDPDEPAHDGKWVYTRNCSGCHNDNGDGRGKTILDLGLTARDFKQGGFAFGDSREQLIRTVSTGIPGRSPMPSFKGVLSDDEIGMVVDYVRTLMPPRKDDTPKNTIMLVRDKPVIARGKLPPLVDGGADIPRGLLIGTPEGMTFEYDLDGVKLIAVRLGAFCDREDWHDRGGGYLKPLGSPTWSANDVDVSVQLENYAGGPDLRLHQALHGVLRSTSTLAPQTGLTYAIVESSTNREFALVNESLRTRTTSFGPAFERVWNCRVIDGLRPQLTLRFDAQPVSVAGDRHATWHVHDLGERGVDVWRIDMADPDTKPATRLQVTCVRVPKWSDQVGTKLVQEIAK